MLLTEIGAQTKSLTKIYVFRRIVSIAYTGKQETKIVIAVAYIFLQRTKRDFFH